METLQRTANRGSISTGFDIDNSVKLEPDNSEYFNKTFGSAGNRKTWSYSCWIKKTELFSSNGGALISAYPDVNNRLKIAFSQHKIQVFGKVSGSTTVNVRTNRLYRDTSAFYHILVVFDTTQGTAANRVKIYTNGVLEDSFDQTTYPSQNNDEEIGNSSAHYIGQRGDGSSDFYAGYITEINYVNGQALAPTDFGEFDEDSGIWKPKAYTGSYGTNGFYLDFADASDLGDDESGNGNDWTEVNLTAADQATDTPTNNFCTWNPLYVYASQPVISEGATKVRYVDSIAEAAKATIGLTNGKWYWEAKPVGIIGSQYIGIQTDGDDNIASGSESQSNNYTMTINATGRYYSYSNSQSESADQGFDLTTSDWLGIALDMDSSTQTIKYYKNGTLFLTRDLISNMQGETVFPFLQNYENRSWDINFGGYTINTISSAESDEEGYGTFEYAPPSGYYAICSKNLAEYG